MQGGYCPPTTGHRGGQCPPYIKSIAHAPCGEPEHGRFSRLTPQPPQGEGDAISRRSPRFPILRVVASEQSLLTLRKVKDLIGRLDTVSSPREASGQRRRRTVGPVAEQAAEAADGHCALHPFARRTRWSHMS